MLLLLLSLHHHHYYYALTPTDRRYASEPVRCMPQMPDPIAMEPPTHQLTATLRSVVRTRLARSSATNEAKLAINSEATTVQGS